MYMPGIGAAVEVAGVRVSAAADAGCTELPNAHKSAVKMASARIHNAVAGLLCFSIRPRNPSITSLSPNGGLSAV